MNIGSSNETTKRKLNNMTKYKVNIQKDLKDTPFKIVSTVLETTDKKEWWDKIKEYRKTNWIHMNGTIATVEL